MGSGLMPGDGCDIPELCPGVGPSMGGASDDLALAVCDIPELCPGVGPSMGGFNIKNLQRAPKLLFWYRNFKYKQWKIHRLPKTILRFRSSCRKIFMGWYCYHRSLLYWTRWSRLCCCH